MLKKSCHSSEGQIHGIVLPEFWPAELEDNKFILLKPLNLWYFGTIATEYQYTEFHTYWTILDPHDSSNRNAMS